GRERGKMNPSRLESPPEMLRKAVFVQLVSRRPAVGPILETRDEHGVVDEVDQRAGTVRRDHLTLPELAVRTEGRRSALGRGFLGRCHSSHSPSFWGRRRIQIAVLGSTSRKEVGATKGYSSSRGGMRSRSALRASSSGVWSKDFV